ncbi:gliding motility-associated C-terminal domain-containing protein [Flavobacterium pectinovorum]|uniref:Gliding motility-associated C-terminal domain-containing protein n=1 Tax=Flavobacterium pectinovorum TaxID=29533 RepID=A0A502EGR0_9FLAO|nr:gliding motility-associated C-terminal domain-containing protein [Flavobacterium pectinovorum]TPG36229.1 gliding motility-associated C-terminal domain-containing protein [Flavobacterium pectinovorum]
MKKNDSYKVTRFSLAKYPGGILGLMFVLLACQKGQAQEVIVNEDIMTVKGDTLIVKGDTLSTRLSFINNGIIEVKEGANMHAFEDYTNQASGSFKNDGDLYILKNWNNYGKVNHSGSSKGKTFFIGSMQQTLSSKSNIITSFQDVIFDNDSEPVSFAFGMNDAVFAFDGKAEFLTGIVQAGESSLVVFNENATHEYASDFSFVDGKVQKKGNSKFEFPVGTGLYFRPSYHDASNSNEDKAYTAQYFYNSRGFPMRDISRRDVIIEAIDDVEYWNVIQDQGTEKIVLTLTLDSKTTPAAFLEPEEDKEVAIVRWDERFFKWVYEGGVTGERDSDASKEANYTKLVTSPVSGYGMFALAIVKKKIVDPTGVIVYNAISPNGDGLNDSFLIEGIHKYPDNEVEIYNRWGVKVYDAKSYNENDVMFRGYSDGRVTVKRGEKLPTGTYFYILKYNNGVKGVEKSGYLYINNQ